jgi:hypothetical protein
MKLAQLTPCMASRNKLSDVVTLRIQVVVAIWWCTCYSPGCSSMEQRCSRPAKISLQSDEE